MKSTDNHNVKYVNGRNEEIDIKDKKSKNSNDEKRRSGLKIMLGLVGLVKPLLPIMIVAIVLGVLGFLCAIFLTIVAGYQLIRIVLLGYGAELTVESHGFFI